MKQLLTILLLLPLFMSCSKDDDKTDEGMTDAQKEQFLVGQWSWHNEFRGKLCIFKEDKTFQLYDMDIPAKTIKKSTETNSSGTYSVKGNRIMLDRADFPFSIKDENTAFFNGWFTRDTEEYTEVFD